MKNMTWIPSFKLDFNEVHLCGAFICNVRVRNVVLDLWTIRNSKMQADNFLSNTFTLRNFTNTSRVQPYWHFTSQEILEHLCISNDIYIYLNALKVRDCTKIRVHLTGGKHF